MKTTLNLADFKALENIIEQVVDKKLIPIQNSISDLYSMIDGYFKRSEDWYQEFIVLRAQHNHVKHVLVRKNVATEQELSITGS